MPPAQATFGAARDFAALTAVYQGMKDTCDKRVLDEFLGQNLHDAVAFGGSAYGAAAMTGASLMAAVGGAGTAFMAAVALQTRATKIVLGILSTDIFLNLEKKCFVFELDIYFCPFFDICHNYKMIN